MRNPFAAVADEMRMEATYYRGAAYDRLNQDWYMWRMSADQAMQFDLPTLRGRSRELIGNNSTAAAIPKILAENVIGKDGIVLQALVETTRGDLSESVNDQIENAWAEFSEDGNPGADGQGGLIDLERLWAETECTDGETILYHVEGYKNKWGYAVDTIDADQLDHTYRVAGSEKTNAIRMGVEVDQWHKPVRYWMWTSHPSEPEGKERVPVDASKLEHVYQQIRPKASRGLPWLTPAIFDINMLGGFRDAAITAARVGASAMGFFTQDQDSVGPMTPTDGGKVVPTRMQPGLWKQLPPGTHVETYTPQYPNTSFREFDQSIVRTISTGQRVSYMSLSNDLSSTSFASGRIGLLSERSVFQFLQQRFIRRIMTPIYRRWLKCAMLAGALKLPTMRPSDYYKVTWHPRSFPWIDPVKDMDIIERSIALGIDTRTRACAEQGRDFEKGVKTLAREMQIMEKYGVPSIVSAGRAKPINVDETEQAEEDKASDGASTPTAPSKNGTKPAGKNGQNGTNGHRGHVPILR